MYGQNGAGGNALPAPSDSPYEDERVAKQTKVIWCVFDLETTGLSRKTDDIVEISAQLMIDKEVLSTGLFHKLVKPRIKIPMDASAIHGITDEKVEQIQLLTLEERSSWSILKQITQTDCLLNW